MESRRCAKNDPYYKIDYLTNERIDERTVNFL